LTCTTGNLGLEEGNSIRTHNDRWICYERGPDGILAVLQGCGVVDEKSWKTMDV
jgi:hypothetical protein